MTALIPSTVQATQTAFWLLLVSGIALTLGLIAYALTKAEDWLADSLTDREPQVEDVTERRLHAGVRR